MSNPDYQTHDRVAAVDITTGYAITDFASRHRPTEPWAEECFVGFVDAVVNHEAMYYPHATEVSIERDTSKELPLLLHACREASLITSHTDSTAEDQVLDETDLRELFRDFTRFALKDLDNLHRWLGFHWKPSTRRAHAAKLPTDIQAFVTDFLESDELGGNLPAELGIPARQAEYAFDVFLRGEQYYRILSEVGALYFNHPIRQELFGARFRLAKEYQESWSWGVGVASLLRDGAIARDPDEIVRRIGEIREALHRRGLTWYDAEAMNVTASEYLDEMKSVAATLRWPAHLTEAAVKKLEGLVVTLGATTDALSGTYGLVTLAVSTAFVKTDPASRPIPGKVGSIRIARGDLAYPGEPGWGAAAERGLDEGHA